MRNGAPLSGLKYSEINRLQSLIRENDDELQRFKKDIRDIKEGRLVLSPQVREREKALAPLFILFSSFSLLNNGTLASICLCLLRTCEC
jgi:hypothetical protein